MLYAIGTKLNLEKRDSLIRHKQIQEGKITKRLLMHA